ncbi:MAG: LacI family transcriptional regulator [Victivallaceae bacterium]|nr:LacI family transcriptional regulator [Victivallaceae bacterium]
MSQKINIRKIAELAGCSPSTVSRVLANKENSIKISDRTSKKILKVCRELDYHPSIHASRLFSRQANVIGLMIPAGILLEDDNLARSISAVHEQLQTAGFRMLLLIVDQAFLAAEEHLNCFKRQEIDGMIIWGITSEAKWLDELHQADMPFILLGNRYQNYPYVACDNYAGTAELIKHCIKRGAEKFIYITAAESDICFQRRKAYTDSLTQYDAIIIKGGSINIQSGIDVVPEIIKLNPNAVICGNDRLAIGVETALIQAGFNIPADLMIVGADNIELSEYCPVPLTTFDQMAKECARASVIILLEHLQYKKTLTSITIKPEIHIRQST